MKIDIFTIKELRLCLYDMASSFCLKIIREKNIPFYERRSYISSLLFLNKFERRLICGKT